MPKKIEEQAKRSVPLSFSEKLKREQLEFNQKQRQTGASAVTTEVVKQINGWSEGQGSFNNKIALVSGAGGLVGIGFIAYDLYKWSATGTINYAHLAVPFILFLICVGIFIYGQKHESPKASFTELKEAQDVWLKGEEK